MARAALAACVVIAALSGAAEAQGRRVAGEGEMCGGIAGVQCGEGLHCDPMPGACRGADISGTCKVVPDFCTREYVPVCGCDGKTYGNDCDRRSNKVAKDHDGEC